MRRSVPGFLFYLLFAGHLFLSFPVRVNRNRLFRIIFLICNTRDLPGRCRAGIFYSTLSDDDKHIILFDGVCNLCNGTVQFLIKRDSKAIFRFASLQSETGQELLRKYGLKTSDFETFVYINGSMHYTKSSAALYVLRELGGLWQLFFVFILLPKRARDLLYNTVVNNRYKWFGKLDSCMVPTPDLKDRFL